MSKARKLITVGAAIAALEILAVALSPAFLPGETISWSNLPLLAAGALGLAAGALDVGLLLRLGRGALIRPR